MASQSVSPRRQGVAVVDTGQTVSMGPRPSGAAAATAGRFTPEDRALLLDHVGAYPPPIDESYHSTFNAGVGEARALTGRDATGALTGEGTRTLWGGTLIYLALLEQIGHSLRPLRGRTIRKEPTIEKAIRQFAPRAATQRQRQVLYALRCAFAHEFGLFNDKAKVPYRRAFRVDDTPGGPLVIPPRRTWSGKLADLTSATQTTVYLVTVGDLAEDVVRSVRGHAISGTLRSELATTELRTRFGFRVIAS
jgi:hypothetical protein